jgi:hypothetical protein
MSEEGSKENITKNNKEVGNEENFGQNKKDYN